MIQRFLSEGHQVRATDFALFISENYITARFSFLVGIPLSQAELAMNSHHNDFNSPAFSIISSIPSFFFPSFYYSNHYVQTSREFLCGGKISLN